MRNRMSVRALSTAGASSPGSGTPGKVERGPASRGLLGAAVACALLVSPVQADEGERGQPAVRSVELMAKAKEVYARQCAMCHGETGNGDGEAAYLLFPKPRNFRSGYFRLTTTQNRVPTDADLFRAITRGIPASSMAGWEHLAEDVRWGLTYVVRQAWQEGLQDTFREEDLDEDEAAELIATMTTPGEPIAVPPVSKDSPESRVVGREIYVERCQSCHGADGRGDGTEKQVTIEGYPISPADYTQGLFKGGSEPEQLYCRIAKGMAGTPMPESELAPEQIWNLVYYIRSLARPGAEQNALQGRITIPVRRIAEALSDDPRAAVWSQASPRYIAVRPLWWRKQRIDGVTVRALSNSKEIGLLLSWEDPSQDWDALKNTQFGDGVAVQFSLDADPPFFGMGSAAKPVNIWHWKAVWGQDTLARRDVEQAYLGMGIDDYPGPTAGGASNPGTIPPSKVLSATFLTGQGAGNALSAMGHPSPVEDLNSGSFGTLSAQPKVSQNVSGKGAWNKGIWRVVLRRPLETKDRWDVNFSTAETARMALAVWNGDAGDRDGQKSVSMWHDLVLTEGGNP